MVHELYQEHCCNHNHIQLAAGDDGWDAAFEDFAKHAYDGNGNIHLPTYFKTAQKLADAITEGIGTDYEFNDPANGLAFALRNNLYQFSGAKNLFEQRMLASLITDDKGNTLPFKEYLAKVKGINEDYNKRYLQVEYNNAIAGASMALKWQNLVSIGTQWIEYRTVGDERVRDAHKKLDGLVLSIDSPVWNRIYPPNAWGCRCSVVPADKPANPVSDSEAGKMSKEVGIKPLFQTNVGKTELVFNNSHPYFKGLDGKNHELDAIKNYGMKPIDAIMKNASDFSAPSFIDDYDSWWENMVKNHGVNETDFVLTDSIGNKILFDATPNGKKRENYFKDHIVRKKEGRENYAGNIIEMIANPHEQWSKGNEMYYISYYNDSPYLLTVIRKDGVLKAETFYPIDKAKYNDGEIRKKRAGVLLAKK